MIDIELDDREVQAALKRLQQRVSDMRPVMADIGELLVERAKERFATSTGPDGKRWEPNAPATILSYLRQYGGSYRKDGSLSKRGQARAAANKPLIGETKQLMGTLYYRAGRDAVTIGSPLRCAAIHQFGGKAGRGRKVTIPARPWSRLRMVADSRQRQNRPVERFFGRLTTLVWLTPQKCKVNASEPRFWGMENRRAL
ncbi:MAG: phage virion morphogenesis protein [Rhodocyclaceae bacterium]|nr:phage virion morphogenesis protein [Rhodocyclaceae bacterium]